MKIRSSILKMDMSPGRALGGSRSRAVLDVIRHPDGAFEDQLSYLTKTENGLDSKIEYNLYKG